MGACGTDLAAWPSAKHFTSWLCLAPANKISGGKVLSSRTRRFRAWPQPRSVARKRRSVPSTVDCRRALARPRR
ncbi:MAG: transposase [Novosphingobium sp.]